MKIWILLKDFEFAINVTMKQKTDMNWMDTFDMNRKKMRMVMCHVFCKFCDEKFAKIPNMMMHKKI